MNGNQQAKLRAQLTLQLTNEEKLYDMTANNCDSVMFLIHVGSNGYIL